MRDLLKNALLTLKQCWPTYWPTHSRYRMRQSVPQVVFMTAAPRTGSTLAKRYLGENAGLLIAPNQPHRKTWRLVKQTAGRQIVIDKRTNNINKLSRLYFEYGSAAWYLGIVRDPRDQFVSLFETDRHPEVPRTEEFWHVWAQKYQTLLDFAGGPVQRASRVALVRYEDLVLQPEAVKSSFLHWLGLEAQPEALSRGYSSDNAIAEGIDVTEDWKAHQHSAVHTGSFGRWRQLEDAGARRIVESCGQHPAAAGLMRRFGYRPEFGPTVGDFDGIDLLCPAGATTGGTESVAA